MDPPSLETLACMMLLRSVTVADSSVRRNLSYATGSKMFDEDSAEITYFPMVFHPVLSGLVASVSHAGTAGLAHRFTAPEAFNTRLDTPRRHRPDDGVGTGEKL